jgi:2-polyprenyl-3-methyl-5-hydroxy-6-metoxy-1,4-benzoquinol methylase
MGGLRVVEPEWLDALSADDPRAQRSRADLRVVNAWMRQAAIMARALLRHRGGVAPARLIDLGAGDGTFMLRVAHKLAPRWRNVTTVLLDREDIVTPATLAEFSALHWRAEAVAADAFEFLAQTTGGNADVLTANLFLHHFHDDRLARLMQEMARCASLVVACEPRRDRFALWASRMVGAIGCGAVTRHDAVASVRAGFSADELSHLWPCRVEWDLHEYRAWPFTHCFVARKRALP